MAAVFEDVAKSLAERTIPTTQAAVESILAQLRQLNTKDQLQSGYASYVEIMQRAFDGGKVRTVNDYVGAYREIAEWLRK